jgi:vacuolar-type H+-ATPase subunit H
MPDWGTGNDDAVMDIVATGNDMLDELASEVDGIMEEARAEAEELRSLAEEMEEFLPELADALYEEADQIMEEAISECVDLCESMAEDGSGELLDMCGNDGQETIIDDALGDFQDACYSLSPEDGGD